MFAPDGHASGWNNGARRVAAWGVEGRIETGEVSEAGHEAEAADVQLGSGVPLDHLAGREVVTLGEFSEVGAVVAYRDRVLAAWNGADRIGGG